MESGIYSGVYLNVFMGTLAVPYGYETVNTLTTGVKTGTSTVTPRPLEGQLFPRGIYTR
jgi:hypothetical protein